MAPMILLAVFVVVLSTVVLVLEHNRSRPAGTVTMWWSRHRGLHDGSTHIGWCVDPAGCNEVEIPVRRDGSIIPAAPPEEHT